MKRKLKDWVIPALSTFILLGGIFTYNLISKIIVYSNPEENIPTVELKEDNTMDVDNDISESPIKPFTSEKVSIRKYYYQSSDDDARQVKSLIKYENIYMPNTGLLYTSEDEFEVVAILSGKVTNIKEDELLGNIIEIEHKNGLVTIYENVKDIIIKEGDEISQGEVIAKSANSNIDDNNQYSLHFEVYKDNTLINPETLYEM